MAAPCTYFDLFSRSTMQHTSSSPPPPPPPPPPRLSCYAASSVPLLLSSHTKPKPPLTPAPALTAAIRAEAADDAQIGPRLRLLCLHGYRSNPKVLEKQLNEWDISIHELLHLTFLQAPFTVAGMSAPESRFPSPYLQWFDSNRKFTEYDNLEEGIDYIAQYMEKNGPFDGLLGFSQGAVLSAYLASLQEKGLLLQDVEPLQLVVIISGAKFLSSKMESAYHETIRCPSIHFIGEKDYIRSYGEELAQCFQNPLIVRHSYGHTIPQLDARATLMVVDHLNQIRR